MNTRIFIGLIISFLSAASYAVGLMPIPQYFDNDGQGELHGKFTASEKELTVFVTNPRSVNIMLPDGVYVNEYNAAEHSFTWRSQQLSSQESLLVIESNNSQIGEYQFTVHPVDYMATSLSVVENPYVGFNAVIGVPGKNTKVNEPFGISAIAYFNGEPVTEALVNVVIQDPNSNVEDSITLSDGGDSVDPVANDGSYSGYSVLGSEGGYTATFYFSWNGKKGRVVKHFAVSDGEDAITLSKTFSVEGIDNNGNGQAEAYRVTLDEEHTRAPGEYTVTLEIVDANGVPVTQTRSISDPVEPMQLDFPVSDLNVLGAKPWVINSFNAWKDDGVVGLWYNFGEVDIAPDTFEKPPLVVSLHSDNGIDDDADGLFDRLEVQVGLEVQVAGRYTFSGDLRDLDKNLVGDFNYNSVWLDNGENIKSVYFSGSKIGVAGAGGPFTLRNFLIYPNFNSSQKLGALIEEVGETGSYSCSEFLGCGSVLEFEIKRVAGLLCDKHAYSILNKLEKILEEKADVDDRQLEALFHRAETLRKSGSCPPAHGFKADFQE